MGLLSFIGRLLLVIINILFLLLGLALLAGGFIIKYGESIWKPSLKAAMNILKDSSGDFGKIVDPSEIDISGILQTAAIALIVSGILLVGITIFGCCGACYKIKCMLLVYAIVVAVLLVAEIIAIGIVYGKPEIIKENLNGTLKDYEGLTGTGITSIGWNIAMIQFKCCGVESYHDFDIASNWNKTLPTGAKPKLTPIACCKELPDAKNLTALNCLLDPFDPKLNNGEKGCFDAVWKESFGKVSIAVTVLVLCGIFQLVLIIFAFIIFKDDKSNVGPI